jgi:hypothetical protein
MPRTPSPSSDLEFVLIATALVLIVIGIVIAFI